MSRLEKSFNSSTGKKEQGMKICNGIPPEDNKNKVNRSMLKHWIGFAPYCTCLLQLHGLDKMVAVTPLILVPYFSIIITYQNIEIYVPKLERPLP